MSQLITNLMRTSFEFPRPESLWVSSNDTGDTGEGVRGGVPFGPYGFTSGKSSKATEE